MDQHEEIFGYLRQSHISKKNLVRLEILAQSENPETAEYARLVIEVAQVKPYKKRRLRVLAQERRDLLQRLQKTGLIYAHHF